MFKNYLNIIIAILLVSSIAGCRSQKGATSEGSETPEGTVVAPTYMNLNSRYTMLTESWKQWSDMESSIKISLTSPAKLNAAGKVWMKRGEWISMSIRMLGFEVATLWVDRDSIVAVDKFHKKYVSESTSKLLGDSNVTLEDMQDLLTGRAFIVGKGTARVADRSKFDFEEAANGWYLLPKEQPEGFNYGFLASDTSNALRGTILEVNNFGSVSANYSDLYESRNGGWFAQEAKLETSRGKKMAATLKWDFNGAKFNTGISKRCNIPDNCERIEMSTLTKLLKSM